jgi:hypothetical protein
MISKHFIFSVKIIYDRREGGGGLERLITLKKEIPYFFGQRAAYRLEFRQLSSPNIKRDVLTMLNGIRVKFRKIYLDRKVAAPVQKTKNPAVGVRHADHVAPSIRKSCQSLRRQAVVARSV